MGLIQSSKFRALFTSSERAALRRGLFGGDEALADRIEEFYGQPVDLSQVDKLTSYLEVIRANGIISAERSAQVLEASMSLLDVDEQLGDERGADTHRVASR